MARLLVIKGADEGKQFELTEPLVSLGRDSANQVRLHDTEVSRRHAEFREVDGGYALLDKASANGTYLNNQRVEEAVLRPGDHIIVGQTTLVYSTGRIQEEAPSGELAEKINLIARGDLEMSSAIIKTIGEAEGSRILSQPDRASPWLKTALANLAIMYETSQAISHILDLNEMLDRLLELVFRSINADRGCFVLRSPDTLVLEPKAIRFRREGDEEKFTVSRTVMDHVLEKKEGVLVSDAAQDKRFNTGQSIVRLGIREVICAPVTGRHETLGVLYLDTQMAPRDVARHSAGKFTEDHLALAIAIGHQAALAVEETRYRQALLHSERLAAVGQTIAALSHHIKNILQGLRSGSEILKMGLAEKNDNLIQQGWRIAEKNQGKIYDLVMDMLSYSKDREPAVEPTDINRVVQDVVELSAGRAKELGVQLETKLEKGLPVVPVDPEGLHRALLNVLGNALDAVEGRPDARVVVGTRGDAGDGSVRIMVLDNGNGISPDKLGDIFKPFVSTKGAKGTGLGLPVSRKILREHGGDLLVTSQPGKGSKFTLRLPLRSPLTIDPGVTSQEMPILPPEAN